MNKHKLPYPYYIKDNKIVKNDMSEFDVKRFFNIIKGIDNNINKEEVLTITIFELPNHISNDDEDFFLKEIKNTGLIVLSLASERLQEKYNYLYDLIGKGKQFEIEMNKIISMKEKEELTKLLKEI